MTTATTTGSIPVIPASEVATPPRLDGRTVSAVMLGVIGLTVLALNLVLIEQVALSRAMILLGTGFVLANRLMVAPVRASIILHVATVLALVAGLAGWCATACGSLEPYERIAGISTAVIGMAMHAIAIFLHGVSRVSTSRADLAGVAPFLRAVADGWSLVLCGASACYLIIMMAQGGHCASCTTAHGLMLVQAVVITLSLLREDRRPLTWFSAVPLVLVGGLSVNAIYHHRAISERVDRSGEMLSYLRTAGLASPVVASSTMAPTISQLTVQTVERPAPGVVGMTLEQDQAIAARAAAIRGRASPVSGSVTQVSTALPAPGVAQASPHAAPAPAQGLAALGSLRTEQDAGWIGDRRAPIEMHVVIDPNCRACAAEMQDISDLLPLVNEGKIAIRFHFVFKNAEIGQVAATILFASGFIGPQQLWETTVTMMSKQASLTTMEDYLAAVPATIDRDRLIGVIRERQQELARLLTDARNLQLTRGVSTTPAVWLHRRFDPEPSRSFIGKTPVAQLELAISSLLSDLGQRRP